MKTTNKETYWSQFANDFEARQAFVSGKEILQLMKEELNKETELGNVLELGCGTGLFTEILSKKAKQVLASDFSVEMINNAKIKWKDLSNVIFSVEDALNLSLENNTYDSVVIGNLIHVISDPNQVIKESYRVLKPGGSVIITSFAVEEMSFINKIKLVFRYIKTFGKISEDARKVKTNRKIIERMLNENSFEIIKSSILGKVSKAIFITAKKK